MRKKLTEKLTLCTTEFMHLLINTIQGLFLQEFKGYHKVTSVQTEEIPIFPQL